MPASDPSPGGESESKAAVPCVDQSGLEAMRLFARRTAHDLRSPVGTIKNSLYFLRRSVGDSLSSGDLEWLEFAESGAARLEQRIQALADYAYVRTAEPAPEALDLSDLATSVLHRSRVDGAAVRLNLKGLGPVRGDRDLAERFFSTVFEELVGTSGSGSGPIEFHGDATHQGRTGRTLLVCEGLDMLAGVPEIGQLFRTKDSNHDYRTGLALETCRAICEKQDWTLEVSERDGHHRLTTAMLVDA